MPESDYIFENGEAIQVGSHGEHAYLYDTDTPVTDVGLSKFVFESGVGLGGCGNITIDSTNTAEEYEDKNIDIVDIITDYQDEGVDFSLTVTQDGDIRGNYRSGGLAANSSGSEAVWDVRAITQEVNPTEWDLYWNSENPESTDSKGGTKIATINDNQTYHIRVVNPCAGPVVYLDGTEIYSDNTLYEGAERISVEAEDSKTTISPPP